MWQRDRGGPVASLQFPSFCAFVRELEKSHQVHFDCRHHLAARNNVIAFDTNSESGCRRQNGMLQTERCGFMQMVCFSFRPRETKDGSQVVKDGGSWKNIRIRDG